VSWANDLRVVHRGQHRDAVCFQCAAFRTAVAAQARRREVRAQRVIRLKAWRRRIRWAYILAWASLTGKLIEGEWRDAEGTFRWTGVLHR
jgi:hypothetical protein